MSQGLVYIVDDEESIRDVLSRLFESIRLDVKAFVDARDFLSEYSPDHHPACLLVDLRMPGMSGLTLQEELKRRGVRIPLIFMTGYGDVSSCSQAMKSGALEFLEKPLNEQKLLDAVYFALDLDRRSAQERARAAVLGERYRRLTPRERQVLSRVIAGLLNKQIAYELDISEGTVKGYRAQVMEKMEASSLPELVRMTQQLEPVRRDVPKWEGELPEDPDAGPASSASAEPSREAETFPLRAR